MTDGPDYQRLMDLIRTRIVSGEYPTGSQIPSTREWEETGWSRDVVRAAVMRLQRDKILRGHPGKGVYVLATPADVASERAGIQTLSVDMAMIKQQIKEIADREHDSDLTALLTAMGRIEANLVDLYGKLGYDYPHGGAHDNTTGTAKRARAR